jgi:hypothetical protein
VQNLLRALAARRGCSATSVAVQYQFRQSRLHADRGQLQAALLQRNATASRIQALAGQTYQSMSDRLNAMRQLQDRLATAQDTKDVQDLQARLHSEQAYSQSQSAQVQTLAIMQVAAYQSLQQQREEERQRDIDAVLAADPNR